jgi:hypothetical protein
MKFFEDKPYKVKRKHFDIFIEVIKKYNGSIQNKHIFNTLITVISDIKYYENNICNTIIALEKTFVINDNNSTRKLLGLYRYYLGEKRNKYKGLVGSRFIKIKYQFDINEREEILNENKDWLEAIKNKVKFLNVESDRDIIEQIPFPFTDENLCKQVINIKYVDEIYQKIIDIQNNKKFEKKKKEVKMKHKSIKNNTEDVNIENIEKKLKEIRDFIDDNKDKFKKSLVRDLLGIASTIKDELKDIKDNM